MRHLGLGLLSLTILLSACTARHDLIHSTTKPPATTQPIDPTPAQPAGLVSERKGLVAGATVSGTIGLKLTAHDRSLLKQATQKALETSPSGTSIKWHNTKTGAHGSVTPQPPFPMNGENCREFQQHLSAAGQMATGYGTACRDKRGMWRIAENG